MCVSPEAYRKALRAIRYDMPLSIQSAYDPEDFVQDASLAVVMGADPGLLIRIAKRRMIDAYRRPDTERLTAEAPFELTAAGPTVQEGFEATELKENLVASVAGDVRKTMISLACQGYSNVEIAAMTGRHESTISRLLAEFRRRHGQEKRT